MTLERPMFPPRDATRRGFLTVVAGGAAAAAVLPGPALALEGKLWDASKVSPALRAAAIAIGESSDALEAAKALVDADEAKSEAWVVKNPRPQSRRGKKRWDRKYREFRYDLMAKSWNARMDAEADFREKQMAVANIEAVDMNELWVIAAIAATYDKVQLTTGQKPIISYSVAVDFLRLTMRGIA